MNTPKLYKLKQKAIFFITKSIRCNVVPKNNSYPDGLGTEIVSMKVLNVIHKKASAPSHREHIFNYVWDNPQQYSIGTFYPADPRLAHPELKLDVDTFKDYSKCLNLPLDIDMKAVAIISILQKQIVADI